MKTPRFIDRATPPPPPLFFPLPFKSPHTFFSNYVWGQLVRPTLHCGIFQPRDPKFYIVFRHPPSLSGSLSFFIRIRDADTFSFFFITDLLFASGHNNLRSGFLFGPPNPLPQFQFCPFWRHSNFSFFPKYGAVLLLSSMALFPRLTTRAFMLSFFRPPGQLFPDNCPPFTAVGRPYSVQGQISDKSLPLLLGLPLTFFF